MFTVSTPAPVGNHDHEQDDDARPTSRRPARYEGRRNRWHWDAVKQAILWGTRPGRSRNTDSVIRSKAGPVADEQQDAARAPLAFGYLAAMLEHLAETEPTFEESGEWQDRMIDVLATALHAYASAPANRRRQMAVNYQDFREEVWGATSQTWRRDFTRPGKFARACLALLTK